MLPRAAALLLSLAAALAPGCGGRERVAPAYERIVLVTLDTLRADHLGAYGYPRATSPFFDALAERGVLFERAYASVTVTTPSHASIFTGLDPLQHGVLRNGRKLAPRFVTLAQRLAESGYRTAAFVSTRAHFAPADLDRGFDLFDMPPPESGVYRDAAGTVDAALAWLAAAGSGKPLLLWVHLFDPHTPWQAPADRRALVEAAPRREAMIGFLRQQHRVPLEPFDGSPERMLEDAGAYDAEIRFADDALRRLVETASRHAPARTLWVFAGDHGEGLGNHHSRFHGDNVYEEQARVPLLFYAGADGLPPRRVPDVVGLVDLFPTLVELAGADARQAAPLAGRSLAATVAGEGGVAASRPVIVHRSAQHPGRRYALVEQRWKYVHASERDDELFDLESDPQELHDRALQHPERAARMKAALLDRVEALREGSPALAERVDEQTLEGLEALGYAR